MKIITITTSNFLLLITGSLLPLICAKFNDGILLNTFNSYVIAIIFASVIDAFQIIQLEYIFSNASFNKLQRLTKSIISKNIAVLILASLAIFIEIYFFDSFFIIVIFSKHIFNYARVVYVLGLNQNSFVINLNLLGSFRNVLLCLSAFISQSPVFFALHIALISALEMGIIYLIVVHYYMLSMDASDIKLPDFPFIINKSIRSIRALDISLSAILNAIDRILITLFDPLIQIQEQVQFQPNQIFETLQ